MVTKDVQAFEIVGGVPAKRLKFRFDDELRSEILDSEWWNLDPSELRQRRHLFDSAPFIGIKQKFSKNFKSNPRLLKNESTTQNGL